MAVFVDDNKSVHYAAVYWLRTPFVFVLVCNNNNNKGENGGWKFSLTALHEAKLMIIW